jgi:thiamine-monophosphate kinase
VFEGINAAALKYETEIVGGDIGGYGLDVFAATAFGFMKTTQALLRSSAKPGDLLCVTGTVGRAITALLYFKEVKAKGFSLSPEDEARVLLAWKRPEARIREGVLLAESGIGHACQDVSDGLKSTIEQMSSLSGQTFTVSEEAIPIDSTTVAMANFLKVPVCQIAMSASVDFELLFTIAPTDMESCHREFQQHGLSFHVIGQTNTLGRNVLVDPQGRETVMPGVPWAQQTGDYLREIIGGQK